MIQLHVNSSLPRSGSELLQALLSQHPKVYASATSPLLEYWFAAYGNYNIPEVRSQDAKRMKDAFEGFCRSGSDGYYKALTSRPVVVDKSRGWLQYGEMLWAAFPDAKMLCMHRKPEEIVASLERIYRANVGHPDTRGLPPAPDQRARAWMTPGSLPLGLATDRLRDRLSRGPDARFKMIDYDDLCANTVDVMRGVFVFLGLESIDVDTKNVRKAVAEDDSHFGIFGRHGIRSVVEKLGVPKPERRQA